MFGKKKKPAAAVMPDAQAPLGQQKPSAKEDLKAGLANIRSHIKKPVVGRICVVLLALVLCAVPVPFINNVIGYLPLMALVLTILISYVYLQILVRSIEFGEAAVAKSCRRCTDVDFSIDFKNKSPLVFTRIEADFFISDLFGGVDTSIPASLVLMPYEQRDFEFTARFDHIGEYEAGVEKIVIYDLLGLFYRTIPSGSAHNVTVLPRVFDIAALDLTSISVQESSRQFQPIATDDMDYAGVREYTWGDPMKTIHWKLSARQPHGHYFTRLYETQGNPGVSVIIDHTAPAYTTDGLQQVFDGVIEAAVSTCLYAYERGVEAEIDYLNAAMELSQQRVLSVGDSLELVRTLPRITVEEGQRALRCLRMLDQSIYAKANLVMCTAHVTQDIISSLMAVKNHQRNPLLFVVVPDELEGNARRDFLAPLRQLENAGITYYILSSAADLLQEGM